jgi:K(+)-stimulated pyrophosphate-energized sodium pump
MNPVIKFTTLFGLLAVELAAARCTRVGNTIALVACRGIFFAISLTFVWRSFYRMRIGSSEGFKQAASKDEAAPAAG